MSKNKSPDVYIEQEGRCIKRHVELPRNPKIKILKVNTFDQQILISGRFSSLKFLIFLLFSHHYLNFSLSSHSAYKNTLIARNENFAILVGYRYTSTPFNDVKWELHIPEPEHESNFKADVPLSDARDWNVHSRKFISLFCTYSAIYTTQRKSQCKLRIEEIYYPLQITVRGVIYLIYSI